MYDFAFKLIGLNPGDFAETNDCNLVKKGASCTIQVTFAPSAVGTRRATLMIRDAAINSPPSVTLVGTGTDRPSTGRRSAAPPAYRAGTHSKFVLILALHGTFTPPPFVRRPRRCSPTPRIFPRPPQGAWPAGLVAGADAV
jgi:hypothetical protein